MSIKDKIIIYLYNKQNSLDEEFDNHEQYYKYRKKDENDYLESIILKSRKDLIGEIISDIMVLLKLDTSIK